MKKKLFIAIMALLTVSVSFAQTKNLSVYKAYVGMLEEEGATCYYTPGKYTTEELRNTEILTVWAREGIYWPMYVEYNSKMTSDEYDQKIKDYIKNCVLVKTEFWENVRKESLKRYVHECELRRVTNGSVNDPTLVKNSIFSEYFKEYVDAINGTDEELMVVWRKTVTESAKNNASPQKTMKKFREDANKPDWAKSARKEILIKWYNCMNELAHKGEFYKSDANATYDEFKKLFIKMDHPNYEH